MRRPTKLLLSEIVRRWSRSTAPRAREAMTRRQWERYMAEYKMDRAVDRAIAEAQVRPAPVQPTAEEFKDIVRRAFEREPREVDLPPGIGERLMRFEPPTTRAYVRLLDKAQPMGAAHSPGYKGIMVSPEEARRLVMQDPGRYIPRRGGGEMKRVFEAMPGEPGEILSGVGYERAIMEGLPPGFGQQAARIKETVKKEAGLGRQPEALSPLMSLVMEADDIWRNVLGGLRGTGGRMWQRYWEGSKVREAYTDTKEYFTAMYVKWRTDPEKLMRGFPTEGNWFKNIMRKADEPLAGEGGAL
ncbi:MAG: hypothetical protein DDT19_01663 [Syntrophomonadaceae bacterium]|nr:hypothetical protein [Bacillota bacterium]